MINVIGVLITPLGEPIPNQDIRLTARINKDQILTGSTVIYTTNELGEYDFDLGRGMYHIEILVSDTFKLIGDIRVDDSTPNPISLPLLVQYSLPILVGNKYPPHWEAILTYLALHPFTTTRTIREQIEDDCSSVAEVKETQRLDDEDIYRASHDFALSAKDVLVEKASTAYYSPTGKFVGESELRDNGTASQSSLIAVEQDTVATNTIIQTTGTTSSETFGATDNSIADSNTQVLGTTVFSRVKSLLATSIQEAYEWSLATGSNIVTIDEKSHKRVLTRDEDTLVQEAFVEGHGSIHTIAGKTSSVLHSNTGVVSSHHIVVDSFKVNENLEVDGVLNRTTIRGTLRVTAIEDGEGNPILPEDGSTIFQVYQYASSANGPWFDVFESFHVWRRHNWSVDGVVDPEGWSVPVRIVGDPGNPGDTIYWEYQYSPDGVTNWTENLKAGDKWRQERKVTNGVAGAWSTPTRIVGDDGTPGDTIELRYEYSEDGVFDWHFPMVADDEYQRTAIFENGVQQGPWSDPVRIKGNPGDPGQPGIGIEFKGRDTLANILAKPKTAGHLWISDTAGTLVDSGSPSDGQAVAEHDAIFSDGSYWIWAGPFRGEDGEDGPPGSDGQFLRAVYLVAQNEPSKPTGTLIPPSGGWDEHPPSVVSPGFTAWVCYTYAEDSTTPTGSGFWTDVGQWSKPGDTIYEQHRYGETPTGFVGWTGWGGTQTDDHIYRQSRTVTNGTPGTEGPVHRIKGKPGSGWYTLALNGGNWPGDAQATVDFVNGFGRAPLLNDHLTYVDSISAPSNSDVKRCNSPEGSPITWATAAFVVQGDQIVTGTLSAKHLVADTLTGNEISASTTIIAGSGSWTAGMNGDDGPTSGEYEGWRFWSGATNPAWAPFRVNKDGKLWCEDGVFEGHIVAHSGSFSGNLIAADGTFKGSLSAANGTFTGTLQGVDGTFTGTIEAERILGDVVSSATRAYSRKSLGKVSSNQFYGYIYAYVSNSVNYTRTMVFNLPAFSIRYVSDNSSQRVDYKVQIRSGGSVVYETPQVFRSLAAQGTIVIPLPSLLRATVNANTTTTLQLGIFIVDENRNPPLWLQLNDESSADVSSVALIQLFRNSSQLSLS